MEAIIKCAGSEDLSRLELFLQKANLSTEGIQKSIDYFLIMENKMTEMKATIGIEPIGKIGLLRSLAITKGSSEKELFLLFEQILKLAKDKQLETLYLASNKKNSLEFFRLLGFVQETSDLPAALHESEHVKHILTVDNSYFLKLSI
ncbi:hypothetical protein KHA94_07655 [Bacillus sp. FJAT-49705]|uniref:N-acetylglutamate synthase-like GNAT family acetyltransferase n=1 Tax=Cytobacillus citreus TaxID=2833586 RepID=A0ABS5NQJ7_9BACI|nr:hypothetical protein [Cytobacillus citreus]MBS4190078.1 hypothetical protein [Cytobacillus citreus]